MYELTRNGPNYRNLTAAGITAHSLEPMDFWRRRWRFKVRKPSLMKREQARVELTDFVRSEWDATDLQFYVDRNAPDLFIVVVFTTNAL
jgi:hypothetical protein